MGKPVQQQQKEITLTRSIKTNLSKDYSQNNQLHNCGLKYLIMIPKPGKLPHQVSLYRPISLFEFV